MTFGEGLESSVPVLLLCRNGTNFGLTELPGRYTVVPHRCSKNVVFLPPYGHLVVIVQLLSRVQLFYGPTDCI